MRKKKIIAVVFALFILLPLAFSGGLQLFQRYLKYRVSERLTTESLVNISVPAVDVEWVEEGREVRIRGEMFDLESYEEKDGVFIAKGVWDEEETDVMNILSRFNDGEQTNLVIRMFLMIQTLALTWYITDWLWEHRHLQKKFPLLAEKIPLALPRTWDRPPRPCLFF